VLRLNSEEFVKRTPGHEAAHIIAVTLFQELGHGPKWREVMGVIGQPALRAHNMEVQRKKVKKYNYVTSTGYKLEISAQRHGKIQRRGATYTVRGEGKLDKNGFVGLVGKPPSKFAMAADEPKAPAAPSKGSKKDIATEMCKRLKAHGMGYDMVINSDVVLAKFALELGTTAAQARKYIKGHWPH